MPLRSLRALTLAFLLVFLGVTITTALVTYRTTLTTIDQLVKHRLADVSSAIAPEGAEPPMPEIQARIAAALNTREQGDLGFILTDDGAVLLSNLTLHRSLPVGFVRVDMNDHIAGLTHGWAFTRDLGLKRRMTVIAETEPFDSYRDQRKRIYLFGFGAIAAIAIAATLVFGATIGRRIREMRQTVEAIIEGDLTRRVPASGTRSEFDLQAQAFNRMLAKINELMDEVRNVSNGIAHELRTPLARLRNRLSLLAGEPAAAPVREEIAAALAEADRLLAMFAAMLRVADVESGERRRRFATTDLAEIARECAETLEPVVQDREQRLETGTLAPATIRGDAQLLTQMILNLLENAISHTPPGTRILLDLRADGGKAILSVADNGPGIPASEREKALSRFGRLHHSEAPGHGLGLALAASVARLHGGTLDLTDAAPGLRVVVTLPLRES